MYTAGNISTQFIKLLVPANPLAAKRSPPLLRLARCQVSFEQPFKEMGPAGDAKAENGYCCSTCPLCRMFVTFHVV